MYNGPLCLAELACTALRFSKKFYNCSNLELEVARNDKDYKKMVELITDVTINCIQIEQSELDKYFRLRKITSFSFVKEEHLGIGIFIIPKNM